MYLIFFNSTYMAEAEHKRGNATIIIGNVSVRKTNQKLQMIEPFQIFNNLVRKSDQRNPKASKID